MPPKKQVPFNGDERATKVMRERGRDLVAMGNEIEDLDRVRAWAREGDAILDQLEQGLGAPMRAVRAGADADPLDVVACFGFLSVSQHVRGAPLDPMAFAQALDDARAAVARLVAMLPTTATMDAIDAADEVMARASMTREETAIMLGTSVPALETRRKRR